MKVEFPVNLDGRTVMITEEVETQVELFAFLSDMQDLFSSAVCRRNGEESESVRIRVRTDDEENKYYEMYCYQGPLDCIGAVKRFGCNKKGGGLFPKNKDKDGNYLPNNGWVKWNKVTQKEE